LALIKFSAIFFMLRSNKPKCCDRDTSLEAWNYLKQRLDELGLTGAGGVPVKKGCVVLEHRLPV
jgi:hypothetical protein